MIAYAYKAMDDAGKIKRGHLIAPTVADLESRLKQRGLDLLRARPAAFSGRLTPAVPRRNLIEFCFHLEQLMQSGVPIVDALRDLRDSAEHVVFRDLLSELANDIETGSSLSGALARQPHAFDRVFVHVVAAGEHAGKLPEVLRQLSDVLKWQDELAAHTRRLTLYPAFLGVLVTAILVFLLVFLVPKVAGFLSQLGHTLPLSTRILLSLSQLLTQYWLTLTFLIPAGFLSIHQAVKKRPMQRDKLKLSLPLLGPVLRKLILARLASLLGMMYSAGIPILDALHLTIGAAGNRFIEQGLRDAEQQVRDGASAAAAFENTQLFPALVIRMLHVGESTGALDVALQNVAYFYSRDAKESVARMQVLLEPVLTVIVGSLLGWIMLAVLGPVYESISRIRL